MDCQYDGIQRPCGEVLNALSNRTANLDTGRMPTWNALPPGVTFLDDGAGATEDFSTTKDHPDKWVDGAYAGGGDIFGGSRLSVNVSSLFAQQTKQPVPWTVQNNIPVISQLHMGFRNALHILEGKDNIAKSCKDAIATNSNPDPIATLHEIFTNGSYHPDEIIKDKDGLHSDAAARTTGIGKGATTDFYAPYWSRLDGSLVIVDGKRVVLSLYQTQVLIWLHEASHGSGKYTHGDDTRFERNNIGGNELNAIIYKNCIKGAKLLPQPPPPKNCPVCK